MKFALGIEYDGTDYHGWQRQPNKITVQGCIEKALSEVANHNIEVQCAGRTDAGVHALGQVIHFESNAERDNKAWVKGVNANLPSGIRVIWVKPMPEQFHARFSAVARSYRYVIYNEKVRPSIMRRYMSWHPFNLDEKKMHWAGQSLLGENDFSSFRSSGCQSNTPMRNVHYLNVKRENTFVIIDIKANAFLHHMVRNIIGVLLPIGEGEKPITWAEDVLALKDRTQAGVTATGQGLCLVKVDYKDKYELPEPRKGAWF